jgi:hypothetical protein
MKMMVTQKKVGKRISPASQNKEDVNGMAQQTVSPAKIMANNTAPMRPDLTCCSF